jgi:hypothetical protein
MQARAARRTRAHYGSDGTEPRAPRPPPPLSSIYVSIILFKLYGPLPATGAGTARAPPPSLISDWWFLAEVSTLPTTTPLPLPYTPATAVPPLIPPPPRARKLCRWCEWRSCSA